MDDHGDGVVKMRTRLVYKEQDYACCEHSVEVLVGMLIVRIHASVPVVLGVRIVVLSVPLTVVHIVPILILYQFIQLFTRSILCKYFHFVLTAF